MSNGSGYQPEYRNSWALIVGINNYRIAHPLGYARQDAEAFAEILRSKFDFPEGNVFLLTDDAATQDGIAASFHRFTKDSVLVDDRVVIFYAGHGCTRTGRRGEVGFLVPVDGNPDDTSTLIRWDEFTRNADLIPAKHLFFVMDACYGGLVIQRAVSPGSSRFLKDMLRRYTRQVLTAGKADETVADSGGPRPGHSIFTGHLLNALDGEAADANGVISANAVMAYVYDRVSKDPHSRQSPHFGYLDGDGDFIFRSPILESLQDKEGVVDSLVISPPLPADSAEPLDQPSLISQTKDYLSDARYRIKLDDLVTAEIRSTAYAIGEDLLPVQAQSVNVTDIAERLGHYEGALSRLNAVTILLGKWGGSEYQPLLERIMGRLADGTSPRGGNWAWLTLRWYPIMFLMYSGGIAALSSGNYASLFSLFMTKVKDQAKPGKLVEAIKPTVEAILDLDRDNFFKSLPGHERYYAPRSEYLYKTLQPELEEILFLGNSYEDLYDRFEILYALTYADKSDRDLDWIWGPPGRFAWKGRHSASGSPFDAFVQEATEKGERWPPLTQGFFEGSPTRFQEVASAYREKILKQLNWS